MLKSKQRVLKTVIHILLDRVKLLIPVQFVDTTEEQRRQRAEPVPLSPDFRPPSRVTKMRTPLRISWVRLFRPTSIARQQRL